MEGQQRYHIYQRRNIHCLIKAETAPEDKEGEIFSFVIFNRAKHSTMLLIPDKGNNDKLCRTWCIRGLFGRCNAPNLLYSTHTPSGLTSIKVAHYVHDPGLVESYDRLTI